MLSSECARERKEAPVIKIRTPSMKKVPISKETFAFWRLFPKISSGMRRFLERFGKRIAITLGVFCCLYYPVGMLIVQDINDDVRFAEERMEGASGAASVVLMADLIEREVKHTSWTPNAPFFYPAFALDNMPNFQLGMIGALYRFAYEMQDQIGRTRGSSQADQNLDKAAGLLKYNGRIWVYEPSISWLPTTPSNQQYWVAAKSLRAYNKELINGQTVFEARADNLMATLERFAKDLGSLSAVIDKHLEKERGFLPDTQVDDIFYETKGRLYAYLMILTAFKEDFASVIQDKALGEAWDKMLNSLEEAVKLNPLVVTNPAPDGLFLQPHLAVQGFYLLRARTQMQEVANILLK